MKTLYFSDDQSLTEAADEWLQAAIAKFKAKSVFLPAGNTPRHLYAHWTKKQPAYLQSLQLYQIDEVISERHPKMFEKFFQEHLLVPGVKVVPPRESQGVQADLTIVGLGKNGHLAFHEPGLRKDFFFGEVELETMTKQTLQLERSAKGITYGLSAFMNSKAILLLVKGESKQAIFEDFLAHHGDAPVNGLHDHPNLTIMAEGSFCRTELNKKCASC